MYPMLIRNTVIENSKFINNKNSSAGVNNLVINYISNNKF